MKILFVAARLPYPLNTGAKIRAFHLLQALARKHDVTMLTYYGQREEEQYASVFQDMGVTTVPLINPSINGPVSLSAIARSLLSHMPLTVAKYYSVTMKQTLRRLLRDRFDVIHCEHLHIASMLQESGVPFVLDGHNVESQLAERSAVAEQNLLKKLLLFWNHRKMLHFETRIIGKADLVLAVSPEDRHTFLGMRSDAAVRVLENGVDIDYFSPKDSTEGQELVFVGSMDWRPNLDGAEYFLDEILPLIRRSHPHTTFTIVGKDPPPSLVKRAEREHGVTVTGTVADVRPWMERSAVCIIPLRVGGGTRLKVLEGLSMGKAVVSTSLGCEGIACRTGEQLLIADNPQDFCKSVTSLLDNAEKRRTLGVNARFLAERTYGWQALSDKLLRYYDDIRVANPR